MNSTRSDDSFVKNVWKKLSANTSMDELRKNLHEDSDYKEWQETNDKELQNIIQSNSMKSYEEIFSEFGGFDASNIPNDKLEDLIKQVAETKLNTLPEESKRKIFLNWDKILKTKRWD